MDKSNKAHVSRAVIKVSQAPGTHVNNEESTDTRKCVGAIIQGLDSMVCVNFYFTFHAVSVQSCANLGSKFFRWDNFILFSPAHHGL